MPTVSTTPKWALRALAAARDGESFHSIAEWTNRSVDEVKAAIYKLDPNYMGTGAICEFCPNAVQPPRRRICSEECTEVQEILWELTDYHDARQKMIARAMLKNPATKDYNRGWAQRVLAGETPGHRGLVKDSRRWKLLADRGLLDRLPPSVKIITSKLTTDKLREQIRQLGHEPEV